MEKVQAVMWRMLKTELEKMRDLAHWEIVNEETVFSSRIESQAEYDAFCVVERAMISIEKKCGLG